jgi:tetratricopeptide (TPR) repeat protein
MRVKLLTFMVLFTCVHAFAQEKINWPEDPEKKSTAEEKIALYTDAMRLSQEAQAVEPLDWLLTNTPELSESIYINGVKIYEALAEKEKDATKKAAYQDKVMDLYDLRVKYFSDSKADVLDRKAYTAYQYYKDDQSKYGDLYNLFEETIELNGNDVGINTLVAYMDVMRRYKLTGGDLTDEGVLERYDKVNQILDAKLKSGENEQTLEKTRGYIDKFLTAMVTVDCSFIQDKLGAKFKQNPNDLQLAKKIMGLSLSANCSDSPIFVEAAKTVQEQEPTSGVAKIIAVKSSAEEDYETAEKFYNQALELATDDSKKADIMVDMATMYRKQGEKTTARKFALDAASLDPSRKEAYKLVGDMYFNSVNECKKGENKVEDRAIYLAAYEMYKKAGDAAMMEASRAQFPSMEEMFELNMKEGETIKVGCWINETVSLQRRPDNI